MLLIELARPADEAIRAGKAAGGELDATEVDGGFCFDHGRIGEALLGGAACLEMLVVAKADRAGQHVQKLDMAGQIGPGFEFALQVLGQRRQIGRGIGMGHPRHRMSPGRARLPQAANMAGGHRLPTGHGKNEPTSTRERQV